MLPEKFKSFINSYPNFPKEGILFRDITPLLLDPIIFDELINHIIQNPIFEKADAIVGIDARGFIFGTAIANKLKKPLVLSRKKDKLHGDLIEKEYGLEYGKDKLTIQKSSIKNLKRFIIVDDLLATGGTAKCVSDMLVSRNKKILALSVIIELSFLKGAKNLNFPVYSEVKY